MRRHVQTHHHPGRGNPDRPVCEKCLLRAISGDETGLCRIEEADRLSGVGYFVLYRLRYPVLDDQSDPSHLEMMMTKANSRLQIVGPQEEVGLARNLSIDTSLSNPIFKPERLSRV